MTKICLIGVAGGSNSGKTAICELIRQKLDENNLSHKVGIISLDAFYKVKTEEENRLAKEGQYNYDHPDSFDFDLLTKVLDKLENGLDTEVPIYDLKSRQRLPSSQIQHALDVIIVEGILLFYNKELRNKFSIKIFVDADSDVRLVRKISRDVEQYGRNFDNVLSEYLRFVKPSFENYILPTKREADIIIPRGADNIVAIDLIVQHIKDLVSGKKINNFLYNKTNSHIVSDILIPSRNCSPERDRKAVDGISVSSGKDKKIFGSILS